MACGKGIKVIDKHSNVKNKNNTIVSRYIMKPHLISNKKYDLRIYILVTSFDPLRIYKFNDGLVRFASHE
jgi:tubulin polyglutamylase TTLL4